MRVPTVTLKNKKTGQVIIVNEADWAENALPNGIVMSNADWERVSETRGDGEEAEQQAADTAAVVKAQAAKTGEADKAAAQKK